MLGILCKAAQGEAQAARDVFLLALAGRANVNNEWGLGGGCEFGGKRRAEALGEGDQVRAGFQALQTVSQIAGHVIESDSTKAERGFRFTTRVGNDHDGRLMTEDRTSPSGVLAVKTDIDAAGEVSGAEFLRVPGVKNLRAIGLQRQQFMQGQGPEFAFERIVERGAFLTVENGVVDEIGRSIGLVGGDQFDEGLLGHRLKGVVYAALLAHGRDSFFADGFATEGTRAVGGIDEAGIGQRKQLRVQGVEQERA